MTPGAECPNCGAALTGCQCSACGQKADVSIPSLGRFLADALGDLYSFDSRFWRSLVTLAFKPGRLTRYYIEGQREKYVPPLRMYLVTSVVLFVAFSLLRPEAAADAPRAADAAAVGDPAVSRDALARAEGRDVAASEPEGANNSFDGYRARCSVDDIDLDLPGVLRARLEHACRTVETGGGRAFARAYAENIPVTVFVFIPFAAAIMKLLFLFARRKYVEHLVFFLHVHTFFFVTLIATFLVARAAAAVPWLGWLAAVFGWTALLYFLAYCYIAMRHVYQQGYALTTVKYVALGLSYSTAFLVPVAGLFVAVLITR